MQQQKLKGEKERNTGATTGSTNSSLHRFSVDALAGTGSKKRTDLSSDDDNSINSWDEVVDCSDDDDIDVDDVGPPISPTTSDSSRGDSSPANGRRRKL